MKILVTGGAGFIGSAVIRLAIKRGFEIVNVDALTYAACLENIASVEGNDAYRFEQVNICDQQGLSRVFQEHMPDRVMHLAAESHVDRSIDGPGAFLQTNIIGTYTLLETARTYWIDSSKKPNFRFHHVSTDEVFGSLGAEGKFTETTAYAPNSPYSASKASSDHLVRAWAETYGLPTVTTNCSNNYGAYQFPEKLIPVVVLNALAGKPIPIYGKGDNVRDWLYVEDHADALLKVMQDGEINRTYNIGGENEISNLDLVKLICKILDKEQPSEQPYENLIEFVTDRPGHDQRYSIDPTRIRTELDWRPSVTLEEGLTKTVQWYLENTGWLKSLEMRSGVGKRLGTGK